MSGPLRMFLSDFTGSSDAMKGERFALVVVDREGPEEPNVYLLPDKKAADPIILGLGDFLQEGYTAHVVPSMTQGAGWDPADPDGLRLPYNDGSGTYRLDLRENSVCLACEALDPKPWRFTEEQAGRIDWLLCADHTDKLGLILVRQDDE